MKKAIGLMLAMMLLMTLASTALSEILVRDMYVYTKNEKNLYVRSSMSTKDDSNIIGSLPYGKKVTTYGGNFNGWTLIDFGDYGDAYVMYRFLVTEKPEPYKKDSSKAGQSSYTGKDASTVAQMNSLIASARYVEPYTVTVRPSRASGWVYMRWFPSKNAEQMATYGANYELTVLAELKDWLQVSDPATGKVGFIYRSFVQ